QEEIISDVDNPLPFYKTIESQWGGHFKVYGSASWHDDRTVFEGMGKNPYYDGHTDFRLKNKLFLSDRCNFKIHYENILSGGNTLKKQIELLKMFPAPEGILLTDIAINDNRRFFDLTSTIDEDDDYILYHRLDRFMITIQSEFGTISLGRQAQTWGNGFLFNPMDLFNPFAPTDINRDYKAGDDMISAQFDAGSIGNLQFLGVPRRDPSTNELESSRSSVAGKLHFASGTNEFDVILARHYEENVTGFGTVGYLGGAAW
ncbi:MAG: hypothetical protein GY850_02580, partial [bacterium]|nr:hypothetical protein [bacterium]